MKYFVLKFAISSKSCIITSFVIFRIRRMKISLEESMLDLNCLFAYLNLLCRQNYGMFSLAFVARLLQGY